MGKIIKYGFLALLIGLISACNKKEEEPDAPVAFYHWKTKFVLKEKQKEYLEELHTNKLYIKFFDVKWVEEEQEAYPFATLQGDTCTYHLNIVPTVYITNRAIRNTANINIDKLAGNITEKIKRVYKLRFKNPENSMKEIQLDCDWTEGTKDEYFNLIRAIKKSEAYEELGKPLISSTIRLHQVKYPDKMGVPPVDKGMLMVYNMGELNNPETSNSILDIDVTLKYISHLKDYSLPCDIALPLFSWGVVMRDNKVINLLNGWREEEIKDNTAFEHLEANRYKVKEDTYIHGSFIYKNDVIRIEEVNKDLLEEVLKITLKYKNKEKPLVCFYHLNDKIIDFFPPKEIKEIVNQ